MNLKQSSNNLFYYFCKTKLIQKYILIIKYHLKIPNEDDVFKLTLTDCLMLIFIYAFASGLTALLLNNQHITMFIAFFIGFLIISWSLFGFYEAIR